MKNRGGHVLSFVVVVGCICISIMPDYNYAKSGSFPGNFAGQIQEFSSRLNVSFIENKGQVNEQAKFYLKNPGQTVWLTAKGIIFDMIRVKDGAETTKSEPGVDLSRPKHPFGKQPEIEKERLVFAQDFLGANENPRIEAKDPQEGIYNYFLGNDPTKWRTGVKAYSEVVYKDVWEGIDFKVYDRGKDLEQEFIVRPGGDLGRIQVAYRGIKELRLADDGGLIIKTAFGEIKESKPRIYQEVDGQRVAVEGRFSLLNGISYTFKIGPYQPQYALVIDPTLVYSTYLGGGDSGDPFYGDEGNSVAVDDAGNAYVTGLSLSTDFPTTPGVFQPANVSLRDVFVTKINANGTALIYSTYLGGGWDDYGFGISVDLSGNAYVTGYTASSDFPTTPGAFRTSPGSGFVTKLNATGTALIYSTTLGWHNNGGHGIAVDIVGSAYITGMAACGYFTTPGAFQSVCPSSNNSAFVSKLNPEGTAMVYSTFLGGSDGARGRAIAIDSSGNAYVTGTTSSSDFPTTPGAFQSTNAGWGWRGVGDAFAAKVNADGTGLVYSTYLGGSNDDWGLGIAVDGNSNTYVHGATNSGDFPTTPGAFETSRGNGFIAKLNPNGSALAYSTLLDGVFYDTDTYRGGYGIAVDVLGNAYVTGMAYSWFPTTPDAFQSTSPGGDAFLLKLNATGSASMYSTFLGGSAAGDEGRAIALDSAGNAYVTGVTYSPDFPTLGFEFQRFLAGASDAFVTKFAFGPPLALSVSEIRPNRGGDTGAVSVFIHGSGFMPGAGVYLRKTLSYGDVIDTVTIEGGLVNVDPNGQVITTTFDIKTGISRVGSYAHGTWALWVMNPDGTFAVLPDGFTIEAGRPPQVWVDIIGRETIRVGRESTIYILCGNRGNVDAFGIPLWIAGIPKDATWKLDFDITPPPQLAPIGPVEWSQVPMHVDPPQEITIPLLVSRISASTVRVIKVTLLMPTEREFELRSWLSGPIFDFSEGFVLHMKHTRECQIALMGLALNALGIIPGFDCVTTLGIVLANYLTTAAGTNLDSIFSIIQIFTAIIGNTTSVAANCFLDLPILGSVVSAVQTALSIPGVAEECFPPDFASRLKGQVVAARDPNDKVGSQGIGDPKYLSGAEPLRYVIYFENVDTASAPAQEVVITDQLDVSKMDLSTLSLGPIAFGDKLLTPLPGSREFATDVDLRPEKNLIVRVNATLYTDTGLITWRFTSIDPATGQLPDDPLTGFLPPNVNPPEGEGSVLFTVMPKQGLSDGTEIENQATIVFDVNAPMATPTWFNTIDNTAPTPNPMTWATPPVQSGIDSVSMVATTASDPVAPINYLFEFVESPTEGTGGSGSGWLSEPSYTNSRLQANHQYGYRVKARDGVNNETGYSAPTHYAYTAIEIPSGISFGTVNSTSIQIQSTNTPSGLERGGSGILIENTTNSTNSGWKRDNNFWISSTLSPNTSYSFKAKARNGDSIETGYSPAVSKYTLANAPGALSFPDVRETCVRITWVANGNPDGTKYFCENTTSGTGSGWVTSNSWDSCGLVPNTLHNFRVKAKNAEESETEYAPTASKYTLASVPGIPTFSDVTETCIRVSWTTNGNPDGTEYSCENTTSGASSGWIADTSWDNCGLVPNTFYSFRIKAKNVEGVVTEDTRIASLHTLANPPGMPSFSDVTKTCIRANWTSNGNPAGTEYLCENMTNGTNSGWINAAFWDSCGLVYGTLYSFRVKARNAEGVETNWTEGRQSTVHLFPFFDDFITDKGWVGYEPGGWERGPAAAGGGENGYPDPGSDYSDSGDNYLLGFAIGGDYPNDLVEKSIISPPIECTGKDRVLLKFRRYLNVESNESDHAGIYVSTNGRDWTRIWTNPPVDLLDDQWMPVVLDISSYAANEPAVSIGFTVGPTNASLPFSGWNIDDFEVASEGIYPSEGTVGTKLSLNGSHFGNRKGKVLIGGKAVKVLEWSSDLIHVMLTKPMNPAIYDVTIQPREPKGVPPIHEKGGFVVRAPRMFSVDPDSGSAGDEITIRGIFFGAKKGKVYLERHSEGNKKGCKVNSWTMDATSGEGKIVFTVPKGLLSDEYILKVINKVGEDSISFFVEESDGDEAGRGEAEGD